ncbi:hypothetical protein PFISCL1PPCAC_14998 [Pristionchus fissidentatus]|uniref:Uncharacterized protein n=1 Tax=Pristionchus fissidentatus TaxID=1538716 RepID=A0AAV5VVD5_9BILA|nr:hypothetical protein PFISCL1PPCAC_14998 [Pristionchus fissidentatus]
MIHRLLLISSLVGVALSCAPHPPITFPTPSGQQDSSSTTPAASHDPASHDPAASPIEGSGEAIEESTEAATEAPVEETTAHEPELLKEGPAPHQVITELSQEFRESMKDWAGIVGKLGEAAENMMRANGQQAFAPIDEEFFRDQAASHFVQRHRRHM